MTCSKRLATVLTTCMVMLFTVNFAGAEETAHEFDAAKFDKIAKKAVGAIISGNVDADAMLGDMEELLELGVSGCEEHMNEPETPEVEKKLMQLAIDNADEMTSMSLADIEAQWHEGGAAKDAGIDIEQFDHFDEVMCHYDGVVHPATCIICLKEYKKSKNDELLTQIQAELEEVREHMKHLK